MKKLKYTFIGFMTTLLLSGCTSSQTKNNINIPVDTRYDKVFEEGKDISSFNKDSVEYFAYENVIDINKREFKLFITNLDEEVKKNLASNLYEMLDYSIKYKYFEPIYYLFGKNLTMEEIKKSDRDELLLKYFKSTFRGLTFTVSDIKAKIYKTELLENGNTTVTIYTKNFVPLLNNWLDTNENKITLKKANNSWIVVNSEALKHYEKILNNAISCKQKEENSRGKNFDYQKAIEELNLKTCQARIDGKDKNQVNPLEKLSGMMRLKTSAESYRDEILFFNNNHECINMYQTYSGYIDDAIVPNSECKKLNLSKK